MTRLACGTAASFVLLVLAAGCTGGGNSGTSSSGDTSSSGGNSGASSSSGGSSGACTELHIGGTNDPLGGGATSEVTAQAVADLGGAAVFLASAASDYVHGTIIPVDGGWLAR